MEDVEKSFSSVEATQLSTEALVKLQTRPSPLVHLLGSLRYHKGYTSTHTQTHGTGMHIHTCYLGMRELTYHFQETWGNNLSLPSETK